MTKYCSICGVPAIGKPSGCPEHGFAEMVSLPPKIFLTQKNTRALPIQDQGGLGSDSAMALASCVYDRGAEVTYEKSHMEKLLELQKRIEMLEKVIVELRMEADRWRAGVEKRHERIQYLEKLLRESGHDPY